MRDAQDADYEAHLESEQISAYLDRSSSPSQRSEVARHLASCAECRLELAETQRLLESLPVERRGRRRSVFVASLGVAAALAFTLLPRERVRSDVEEPTRRGEQSVLPDVGPSIATVAPADDGALTEGDRRFVWQAAAAGATYHISVQDSAGTPIWSSVVLDTSVRLPPNVKLVRGARYFWSVEAQLADGRSTSSGARRFAAP